jgi:hypothetical protein
VTEGFVEAMPPGFVVGVRAAEKVVEIFSLVFAQVTFVGLDGIVLVGHFCSWEYGMA